MKFFYSLIIRNRNGEIVDTIDIGDGETLDAEAACAALRKQRPRDLRHRIETVTSTERQRQ